MNKQIEKECREIKKSVLRSQDSLSELRNTIRLDRIILQSFLANDSLEIGEGELREVLERVSDTLELYCESIGKIDCVVENARQKMREVF